MATDRPRIQGYIDQEVYDRFVEWKGERGMSEALNQLLAEYFGASPQSPVPNPQSPTMTLQIEEMIEEACELRFAEMKADLGSKLPTKPEINARIDEYLNQQFNELNGT
jgi:hypothetical protein